MHLPAEQDTPYHRASILELSDEELVIRLDKLRERRLRSYNLYQAGLKAKQDAKDQKLASTFDKTFEQVAKMFETTDKQLEKLEKKVLDIQAIRLILGDTSVIGRNAESG